MSISFETLALAKRYTNSAVADAISGVTSINFRFVESLPLAGDPGVIYCVPSGGSEPDLYDEYYYVNGRFERIPGATIDLTAYATKEWINGEGYYKKPADGIPGSDLDDALKASIAKAETALQQHQSLVAYRTAQEQDEIDNTLASIKEIEVGDTKPTDPNVTLWMYQNPGQKIEIPTMEDFRNLKPATDEQVSSAVSDWLEENISGGETIAIDKSLTVEGAAADAKAVGDLKSALNTFDNYTTQIFTNWEQGNIDINTGANATSSSYCRTIDYYTPGNEEIIIITNPDNQFLGLRRYALDGVYLGSNSLTNSQSIKFIPTEKYRLVCGSTGTPSAVTATFGLINANSFPAVYSSINALCGDKQLFVSKKTKLSVETYTFFPFTKEIASFTQETPFIVSGESGDNTLTITGERSGNTLVSGDVDGAVVIQIGNRYFPHQIINYTDTTIEIVPELEGDVVDGILAPLLADSQHLTKYGYIAYMQYINIADSKHCEKNKYIVKYHPTSAQSPTPFRSLGVSSGIFSYSQNDNAYRKKQYGPFGTIVYPYADYATTGKYGVAWTVETGNYAGYIEIFVGVKNQTSNSYYKHESYPMHIVAYADGQLIYQKDKTTNIIERVCIDFTASQKNITLEIYYDKMRKNSEDSIFIGETTFWVNETYPDVILPAGATVSMLFDSWGGRENETSITEPATPWHSGATWPQGQAGETLKQILADKTGLVCPVFNTSRGSMTSRWGKAWFGVAVREKMPNVMLTDFGINDYHTTIGGTWENIQDPYGNTIIMANNPLTNVEYADNMKMIFDMAIMSNIQPVFIEPNVGASLIWTLGLLYRLSEQVT